MKFFEEIKKNLIKNKPMSYQELNKLKNKLAKKHQRKKIPTNIEILLHCDKDEFKELKEKLLTKPTRTGSGVAVISVMTEPRDCPHAKKGQGPCIMCPGGPKSSFGTVPQSYTGKEPATMRAIRNDYDAFLQVFNRIEQYIILGHEPQKIELIVMGGTFPSYDDAYKKEFIRLCYKAMNDFSQRFFQKGSLDLQKFKDFFHLPGNINDPDREKLVRQNILDIKPRQGSTLQNEQKKNETAYIRCVGLTIETRPDFGLLEQGNEFLELGCTRVELGIQTTNEIVLENISRGHGINASVESTRMLKDLGFKINYHLMPGLPGSSIEQDLDMLKEIVSDEKFRPDMLKIYPTMVLEGTKLHSLWKQGEFEPIDTKSAANLIARFKRFVPHWIRIMRVQRDIPTFATTSGVDRTNLRQYVKTETEKLGIACRCIRCREPRKNIDANKSRMFVEKYTASRGKEFFISQEDEKRKTLFGFCRMRFPSQCLRNEITEHSVLIRELHVYGSSTRLGKSGQVQHKGIGRALLKKAEDIALKKGKRKILVISGIGARDYYRNLGYHRNGPYMAKSLIEKS